MKQEGNSISLCLHYRKSVILSHNLSHDAKLLIQAFTMQQPQNSPARQSLSQAPSERSGVGPAAPHIPGHGSEPTWTAPCALPVCWLQETGKQQQMKKSGLSEAQDAEFK